MIPLLRLGFWLSSNSAEAEMTETIIRVIEEKKPRTVAQLTSLVKERFQVPEEEILKLVVKLHSEGKIALEAPFKPVPERLSSHLKTEMARWYWVTMLLAAATTLIAFIVPEDSSPLVYARYVLGTIFVLWLPGYSFTKALFPKRIMKTESSGDLDPVERVALSIGLSIALVPMVGLLLNYTPWGIRLTPIVTSLFALTTAFAAAGVIREHQVNTESPT